MSPRPHIRRARLGLTLGWLLCVASVAPAWVQAQTEAPSAPTTTAPAAASDLTARLSSLESRVQRLGAAAQSLPVPGPSSAPAASPASTESIESRIAEATVLAKLRNYPAAAARLFPAVEPPPPSPTPASDEALFLLADVLRKGGDHHLAGRLYASMADRTPAHPRSQEALQHLVELALADDALDSPETKRWQELLSRLPPAEQQPATPYLLGKLLYQRGSLDEAERLLASIPAASPYYVRARYLIGAALTDGKKLAEAEREFRMLVERPLPAADDDRRIIELSHMALGRLYHVLSQSEDADAGTAAPGRDGNVDKAHQSYLRISQKSDLFRDAIYEAAWSAIRSKDLAKAEQALELLLLAYRDAPQVGYPATEGRLLLGGLLLRRGELDTAGDRFAEAQRDSLKVLTALDALLAQTAAVSLEKFPEGIPAPARELLLESPELRRLLRVQRDLAESERARAEVERLLSGRTGSGGDGSPMLREVRAESQRLAEELAALHRETSGRGEETAAALLPRLGELERALATTQGRLDRLADVAQSESQTSASGERLRLLGAQRELEESARASQQLADTAVRRAAQAAREKFAALLLRAEAGSLDVAWARKVARTDKIAELVRDQKREVRLLDEEFGGLKAADKNDKPAADEPVATPKEMPEDIAEDYRHYLETAASLRTTLNELGRVGYDRRRREVNDEYATRIKSEEQSERELRTAAIALFEDFLRRHPSHPRYAPDAMFRLAELYFERDSEAYAEKVRTRSGSEDAGSPNYAASVELYQRILRDHAGYRLADGVHYLLGYSLGEMGREAEARQAYLGLACSNKFRALDPPPTAPTVKGKRATPVTSPYQGCLPLRTDSRFLAETWTRIGEDHFYHGELEPAIYSYTLALGYPDSPLFDKVLYKLAWSLYRADRFAEAVRRFDELVVLADQKKTAGDKDKASDSEGSTLRNEAIQYLALSFAERDWDGDGRADLEAGLVRAERFYSGRISQPHVHEVLVRLGDIWFERTEYARAAEAYQRAIERAPSAADNPKLQEKIVSAFDRMRSMEQALRAREALAKNYAPGSPWYEANRDNRAAIEQATELADASLVFALTNRHASAQALRQKGLEKKDPALLAQARGEYEQAADGYRAYLAQHPQAKNAYEYGYLLAESLFYAERYADAAPAYEKVRDSDPTGKYAEEAAYGAVKAREEVVGALYKRGGTSEPPLPAVGKTSAPVQPQVMPAEVAALQTAYDRHVELFPKHERSAVLAYKSAELDFRYLRFDRARTRFERILDTYCQSERAVDAGNGILVSYTIENNLDRLEEWTGRVRSKGCGAGSALAEAQKGSLKKLSDDVRFKKAEQLLERKQYEPAAALFVQIVDADPRASNADKALNNAAVAYENLRRFGAATTVYERIVRDYPQSPFVDEALFRAAVNHQRFFEFDKAIAAYRTLAIDARFRTSPHRRDALFNAAVLAESSDEHALAAELFQRYASDPQSGPSEVLDATFRAARAVEKLGSSERTQIAYYQFVRKFEGGAERDPARLAKVVEALTRLAKVEEKLANPTDAREYFGKAARLGKSLTPGSDPAEFAAQAAFLLAEKKVADLERQKIGGAGKELEQSITGMNRAVTEAVADFEKVLAYKRATWTLAAYFRMGYVFETYAKALLAAPCPPEVRRISNEACNVYRTKIEENVAVIEDKAAGRYAVTLEQAGRLGVNNQWTRLARQRANAYRPDQFPLLKDEHIVQELEADGIVARPSGGELGRLLSESGSAIAGKQYESAIVLARQALSIDERSTRAMLTLARAYYHLGKPALCESIVGMAQKIDDSSGEAYLLLGFLSLGREDRIAATAAFKKATELDPSLGMAWLNLGGGYLYAKSYDAALAAMQRAVALLPGSLAAQLNLGSALRGLRRYDEAVEAYRKVLARDPDHVDALFNLGVLYLDAAPFGGSDLIAQKELAVRYLTRYEALSARLGKPDETAVGYIKEARTIIEREQRKRDRKTGALTPKSATETLASAATNLAAEPGSAMLRRTP